MTTASTHVTSVGADRLVFFTDAVAAIGLTLLVLPLVEVVGSGSEDPGGLGAFVARHIDEFGAFVLSFAVIFRFWWAHHRMFQRVRRVTVPMVVLDAVWCFGVVFLPVPTAIITAFPKSSGSVALYIGTLLLLSGSLTAMSLIAFRNPGLSDPELPITRVQVLGYVTIFVAQLLALVIGVLFADTVGYWPLALMLLAIPIERLIIGRWRRAEVAA